MPIGEMSLPICWSRFRWIGAKGKLQSARRTLELTGSVFRYALATARLKSDPTRDLKGGALTSRTVTPLRGGHRSAGVGELLRSIDGHEGQPIAKLAMQLAPHVCPTQGINTLGNGRNTI